MVTVGAVVSMTMFLFVASEPVRQDQAKSMLHRWLPGGRFLPSRASRPRSPRRTRRGQTPDQSGTRSGVQRPLEVVGDESRRAAEAEPALDRRGRDIDERGDVELLDQALPL